MTMLPRIPFFLVVVHAWCCWFVCVALSLPANNATALYLPVNNSTALYLSSSNVTLIPANSVASTSLPPDVVTTAETLQNSTTETDNEKRDAATDMNSPSNWSAEEIALRVGVIVAMLAAIVLIIKLTLIVHRRCATKDELYAHVNSI
ncbi:uncharacterized protein LOC121385337 [Gigantopelta aegis]|uniref:uncharacterized protein LOC121385337 n=1 Tax=Gigantopelta aegis TaxID=1735272 RepID=UPI001B887729|nr:uncharacterized protein LOC121385337 [Gigantopelta aegis]